MSADMIIGISIGIVFGWAFKFPFLLKWYNEVKATKDCQKAMRYKRFVRTCKKFNIKNKLQ